MLGLTHSLFSSSNIWWRSRFSSSLSLSSCIFFAFALWALPAAMVLLDSGVGMIDAGN